MASYQVDNRGGHYDDLRAGAVVSMLANIHRNTQKRPEPYGPLDLIPWSERHMAGEATANEPTAVLLPDAEAQSKLILSMMFPSKVQ
ncbi:hypothetical protein HGR00_02505 [Ralstonia insidiosa]|uniref:Minor tail T domain-containing protein n=2 Tax=Ralstonia insidiosa TaxID=190721 RepID=A0A848NWA7_9RALS|nr:hypothetical protein [Ralstonia insidiosa]NMV36776.1 hypothetical protein [Ralstonia insidiosa]